MAQFFIDADNSPDSGGHPRWAHEASRPLRGYEFEVMVQLGYRYRREDGSGGFTAGNALLEAAKLSEVQPMATFDVAKLRQGSDSYDFQGVTLPAGWREAAQRASRLDGNTIEVTVPYEWLGLKRGQTIRLCFKDRAIGAAPVGQGILRGQGLGDGGRRRTGRNDQGRKQSTTNSSSLVQLSFSRCTQ